MLMWPLIFKPEPEHDFVAYLQFTIVTSRWGLSAMAAADDIELESVADPVRNPIAIDSAGRATAIRVRICTPRSICW
jgi:hypothetical protein